MENQHRMISGYRDLSPEEIALVNSIKELAEEVNETINVVAALPITDGAEVSENPARALNIARTELQTGFMWLIRAVARPKGF